MISTSDLTQLRASHAHLKLALKKLLEFDTAYRGGAGGFDHEESCGIYNHLACDCGFFTAIRLAHSAVEQAWREE